MVQLMTRLKLISLEDTVVFPGMRRQTPEKPVLVARRDLFVCLSIYGTFLAASAYHVLMNSINIPIDATPGWYLYAVVIPEAILVVAGLLAFKWGKEMVTTTVLFFFALEMYATHFVLIPYYSGLIWHAPDGGLRSFHDDVNVRVRPINLGNCTF